MKYDEDDRIKHLEFVQNVINRMGTNSFISKGWSVTLVTGIIGLSLTTTTPKFVYLAFIPALAFWGLDAYYIRQERLFRRLYEGIIKDGSKVEPFSLDTTLVRKGISGWFRTLFTPNLLLLHLMIILVILGIIYNG